MILFTLILQAMPFVMKELHVGLKGYRSKDSLRAIPNLFVTYRTCELFVKLWMRIQFELLVQLDEENVQSYIPVEFFIKG